MSWMILHRGPALRLHRFQACVGPSEAGNHEPVIVDDHLHCVSSEMVKVLQGRHTPFRWNSHSHSLMKFPCKQSNMVRCRAAAATDDIRTRFDPATSMREVISRTDGVCGEPVPLRIGVPDVAIGEQWRARQQIPQPANLTLHRSCGHTVHADRPGFGEWFLQRRKTLAAEQFSGMILIDDPHRGRS